MGGLINIAERAFHPPPIPQEPDGYENVFFARLGGSMTGKAPALTKLFI